MKKDYIIPELMTMSLEVRPICVVSAEGTATLDRENGVGAGSSLGHETDGDWDDEEY